LFKDGKPIQGFPGYYDTHINVTIPYYREFHDEIINLIKAAGREPDLWLDTGCGTGTLAEKALATFPGVTIMLADPSPEMLKVAQGKLDKYPDRVLYLERGTTQEIELPPGKTPDVVSAVLCHHYLHEDGRMQATRKCYHMLRKGGLYVTFENIRPLTAAGTELGKANWLNFQISSGKTVAEAEDHLRRFGVEYFPITVEQHLELLRGIGFEVVELLWYSYMQAGFYCVK
jgi:tRNA (cmo5U34)-methyltransferase